MDNIEDQLRKQIANQIRYEISPEVDVGGKYTCCGCSTYQLIMEDCIRIVLDGTS